MAEKKGEIIPLSGGDGDGTPIKVTSDTVGTPTPIHTVPDGETHELYIQGNCRNGTGAGRVLTMHWGSDNDDDLEDFPLGANAGSEGIAPGSVFVGPLTISAHGSIANELRIKGAALVIKAAG